MSVLGLIIMVLFIMLAGTPSPPPVSRRVKQVVFFGGVAMIALLTFTGA